MQLRGINFRPVCNAAGAQGFFGEGYPYHRGWKLLGLTFGSCGFVAKTTTMAERLKPEAGQGNMRLKEDGITPQDFLPDCIKVNFRQAWVLNAVGLSGPGAPRLFASSRWQRLRQPIFLSFMSVQPTVSDRLAELAEYVRIAAREMSGRQRLWALEMNYSCPNVGLDASQLINEVGQAFDIAGRLRVPLQAKFSPTVPVKPVVAACQHEECDAVTIGNTVKWDEIPPDIKTRLFGTDVSPLAKYGGGGLSSPELVPMVCEWIRAARDLGFDKPIWAGNGLYSLAPIKEVAEAGASGIQLGCVAILRPWRMRNIIRYAKELFSET